MVGGAGPSFPRDAGFLPPSMAQGPCPCPAVPVVLAVGLHTDEHPQAAPSVALPLPARLPAHCNRAGGESRPRVPGRAQGLAEGSPRCSVLLKA